MLILVTVLVLVDETVLLFHLNTFIEIPLISNIQNILVIFIIVVRKSCLAAACSCSHAYHQRTIWYN